MHPLDACPWDGLNVPRGQGRQAAEEVEEGRLLKLPTGQGVHAERPGKSEKYPALQLVQDALPAVDAALPRGHGVQVLTPAPLYMPRGHCEGEDAEGPLKDPAGVSVQLMDPASAA